MHPNNGNGTSHDHDGWGEAIPANLAPGYSGLEAREYKAGSRPGGQYVRRTRSHNAQFRYLGEGLLQATTEADKSSNAMGKAWSAAKRVLIGPPLHSAEAVHERLSKVKALAVLSSDALSSVAYATEQTLSVLILAGSAALTAALPIAGAIVALLLIVGISYRQTI